MAGAFGKFGRPIRLNSRVATRPTNNILQWWYTATDEEKIRVINREEKKPSCRRKAAI